MKMNYNFSEEQNGALEIAAIELENMAKRVSNSYVALTGSRQTLQEVLDTIRICVQKVRELKSFPEGARGGGEASTREVSS